MKQKEYDYIIVGAGSAGSVLANRLSEVPKDQQIVVVCRSGNRSQQGRDILLQAGYTKVTSMAGGVTEWKTQGFPIEP